MKWTSLSYALLHFPQSLQETLETQNQTNNISNPLNRTSIDYITVHSISSSKPLSLDCSAPPLAKMLSKSTVEIEIWSWLHLSRSSVGSISTHSWTLHFFPGNKSGWKICAALITKRSSSPQHIKIIFSHFSSFDFVTSGTSGKSQIYRRQSVGKVGTSLKIAPILSQCTPKSEVLYGAVERVRKMRLQREASK